MFDPHNKQVLDALGSEGVIPYVHARNVLAVAPTPQMAAIFDSRAHRGLIRKYDNKANKRMIVADHGTADRFEFETAIHRLRGYEKWNVTYTT